MSWPLVRVNTQEDPNHSRYYADEKNDVDVEVNSIRSGGGGDSQIIGSSEMFDENGNIRLIPVSDVLMQGSATNVVADRLHHLRCPRRIQRVSWDEHWAWQNI